MRLTTQMVSRNVLSDLNATAARLDRTRTKASSGKELTRPSDGPAATARALKLRESLDGARQHQRNAQDAMGWQDVAEQALSEITEVGHRARDLLLQGATDTTDLASRRSVAVEIRQLISAAKEHGNASYAGRFVFGGTATTSAPFADADDLYHGDEQAIAREIGPGVSMIINQPGSDVFDTTGSNGLIATLRAIADHLDANDGAALRSGDLPRLDAALDRIMSVRADNGARTNRLEAAISRLGQFEETTTRQLSETEDADFAETMIALNSQQAAYEAALRSGANIVQSSLMDFLR